MPRGDLRRPEQGVRSPGAGPSEQLQRREAPAAGARWGPGPWALPGRGAGARGVAPEIVGGAVGGAESHDPRGPSHPLVGGVLGVGGGVCKSAWGDGQSQRAPRVRAGGSGTRPRAQARVAAAPGFCKRRCKTASSTSFCSSAAGRVRPGPREGQAAAASSGGGGAAGSGGRCLRWRPGRPAPLQRASCIRSPPRPRAAAARSFPSAAAAGAVAGAGTGSPQGRRHRPPSLTRTGSARVTPR